jgi:nucleoside-diphosphate-sugar epimerase
MRVLITGASGFVGRHVVDALTREGHDLGLVARGVRASAAVRTPKVAFIAGDLDDVASIRDSVVQFAPEACVHLAWADIPNYSAQPSSGNLRRSISLIDLLLDETPCRRLVVTGTCLEYGRLNGVCTETDDVRLTSFIAWAKQSLREYLEVKARRVPVELMWLRLFYVYGPGQRSDSLLPTLITNILHGQDPTILNPFNAQDFVYVADVADAVRQALAPDAEPGVYNIGSGRATSVLDMCQLVEACVGASPRVSQMLRTRPVPQHPACFWASTAKAALGLRWKAACPLADGVRRQVKSIQDAAAAGDIAGAHG